MMRSADLCSGHEDSGLIHHETEQDQEEEENDDNDLEEGLCPSDACVPVFYFFRWVLFEDIPSGTSEARIGVMQQMLYVGWCCNSGWYIMISYTSILYKAMGCFGKQTITVSHCALVVLLWNLEGTLWKDPSPPRHPGETYTLAAQYMWCPQWPWWRHQMETFSALLALCERKLPVTGEFPSQRPVTRSFDVFFDLCLNKRLNKRSRRWWFETQSRPLWCHCNWYSWHRDNSFIFSVYTSVDWGIFDTGSGLLPVHSRCTGVMSLYHKNPSNLLCRTKSNVKTVDNCKELQNVNRDTILEKV